MTSLYDAGWTLRQIAQHLHYGHSTVRKALLDAGMELRPRGQRHGTSRLSHAELQRTVVMRKLGLSLGEIGRRVGRTESTIHERLTTAGHNQ